MRFVFLSVFFLTFFLSSYSSVQAAGWGALSSPTSSSLLSVDSYGNTVYAVGRSGTVIYSTNEGVTWRTGLSGTSYDLSGVSAINSTTAVAVGDENTILRTTDGGATWTTMTPSVSAAIESTYTLRSVLMVSSSIGFAVGDNGLAMKTTNGGTTWTEITGPTGSLNRSLNSIAASSTSKIWVAGERGVIYMSSDSGSTWTAQSSGTTQNLVTIEFIDSTHGFASGEAGTFLKTTNGGTTWTTVTVSRLQNSETIDDISFYDDDRGILSSASGVLLQTSDAGVTWSTVSSSGSPVLIDLKYVSNTEWWGVGDSGAVYRYDATSPGRATDFDVAGDNDSVSDTTPTFTWTAATDDQTSISSYYFKVDSGSYANVGNVTSKIVTTALSNGLHTAYLYAVDLAGNTGSTTSVSFTVDADSTSSTSPDVGDVTPATAIKNESVTFSAVIEDEDGTIEECDLYIDGEEVKSMTVRDTVTYTTYAFDSSDTYSVAVRCEDDDGHRTTSDSTTFRVSSGSSHAEPGDIIKIGCTGDVYVNDPCTAVYYYGVDGKRHAFPNEAVFNTWFDDFDDLVTLSSSAMADISLGRNVSYRPGSTLVKFFSNTVYAVSYGSVLRPIASASIAEAVYGSDWVASIQSLSDVFYDNYRMGSSIESSNDFDAEAVERASTSIDQSF